MTFLLSVGGTAAAQQRGGTTPGSSNTPSIIPEECAIAGRVLYGNNFRAAENVSVHLEQRGVVRDRTYTMGLGRFEFRGLSKGSYTVVAKADGFKVTRHEVDLSYFCQSRNTTIMLEPETVVVTEDPAAPMVSARELEIPGKARKAFQKGVRELHEKGNAEKGLKHFQKAIEIHADYDEAYVQLAVANLQLKNPVAAQEALETAVSVYPQNARAQVLLGIMYGGQGDLDAAVTVLQQGVDADENYWLGHYELGKALVNQERHQEALPHAQRAHELNPQNPGVHLLLHDVTLRLQDLETALAEVKEYIELYPDADLVPRLRQHADMLEQTIAARAQ
jgi:tetratricopeptide (TPR) repeat protein